MNVGIKYKVPRRPRDDTRGHPSPHAEREPGLAGCSAFVETRFIASNRDVAFHSFAQAVEVDF